MATMIEKKVASIQKELEKYNKQLIRYQSLVEKKTAKCIKLNCNWTDEEFDKYHRCNSEAHTREQWNAWFDLSIEKDHVAEVEHHIKNALERLNKYLPQAEQAACKAEEDARVEEIGDGFEKALNWKQYLKAEEEFKRWLEHFKAECLKDGIIIEHYSNSIISGSLKNGKTFSLYINDGDTERSLHCYTLYINRECIFTSGLFSTAYKTLRN